MKRKIFTLLVIAILGYQIYSIITKRSMSVGPAHNKIFNQNKALNLILKNKASSQAWENYKNKSININQKDDFINYLKKLLKESDIKNYNINISNIEKNDIFSSLPINIDLESDYGKIHHFIKQIEDTDLFITINNVSMILNNNTNKITTRIDVSILIFNNNEDTYSTTAQYVLRAYSAKKYNSDSIKNIF